MAPDFIRDSPIGQLVNWLSNGHYFPYADQRPEYVVPSRYLARSGGGATTTTTAPLSSHSTIVVDPVEVEAPALAIVQAKATTGDPVAQEEFARDLEKNKSDSVCPSLAPEQNYEWLVDWEENDSDSPKFVAHRLHLLASRSQTDKPPPSLTGTGRPRSVTSSPSSSPTTRLRFTRVRQSSRLLFLASWNVSTSVKLVPSPD